MPLRDSALATLSTFTTEVDAHGVVSVVEINGQEPEKQPVLPQVGGKVPLTPSQGLRRAPTSSQGHRERLSDLWCRVHLVA